MASGVLVWCRITMAGNAQIKILPCAEGAWFLFAVIFFDFIAHPRIFVQTFRAWPIFYSV